MGKNSKNLLDLVMNNTLYIFTSRCLIVTRRKSFLIFFFILLFNFPIIGVNIFYIVKKRNLHLKTHVIICNT